MIPRFDQKEADSMGQGELFSDTKQRLSDLTKIKGKQLDKIKFALVSRPQYARAEELEDSKDEGAALVRLKTDHFQMTSCGILLEPATIWLSVSITQTRAGASGARQTRFSFDERAT